jgi:hypothetical protein
VYVTYSMYKNKTDAKICSQNLYDIFSDLHGKDSKTLICNISWERKNKKNKK